MRRGKEGRRDEMERVKERKKVIRVGWSVSGGVGGVTKKKKQRQKRKKKEEEKKSVRELKKAEGGKNVKKKIDKKKKQVVVGCENCISGNPGLGFAIDHRVEDKARIRKGKREAGIHTSAHTNSSTFIRMCQFKQNTILYFIQR